MTARLFVVSVLIAVGVLGASCGKPPERSGSADVPMDTAALLEMVQAAAAETTRATPFFLQFHKPPQLEIEAKIPQYKLPLTPGEVVNWTVASRHFKCEGTAALILQNGFAVEEGWGDKFGDIAAAYRHRPDGVPVFVTADTALHIQHLLYNQLFGDIEQTYMLADLETITNAALDWFARAYATHERSAAMSPKQRVAVRRNLAYFAVAARLLDATAQVPKCVEREVLGELKNIEAGRILASPVFIYRIDYGQLKPRGYYTKSEALTRYFRAMMWYGQAVFLFQGGPRMIVDAGTADIQTMQALQIGRFLAENETPRARWQRMHAVIEFFAGGMDDVSVADVIRVKQALDAQLASAGIDSTAIGEAAYLKLIRDRLLQLPPPRICAATGFPMRGQTATPERRTQWLEQARGMRVFGQRFSLDGYAMSKLTGFTYTGEGRPFTRADTPMGPVRGYPTGLDVMALLGSERAEALVRQHGDAEYAHYGRELNRLKREFGQLGDEEWYGNAANARTALLRILAAPVPDGYPTAMRSHAWQERDLTTALAAWAQLKHDMILVQKKGNVYAAGAAEGDAWQYAEPRPHVLAGILATTRAVAAGVLELYSDPAAVSVSDETARARRSPLGTLPTLVALDDFATWLEALLEITLEELKNEPLSRRAGGFLLSTEIKAWEMTSGVSELLKHPAVIADIHGQADERRVLEVATGRFNLLWVVYELPDGTKVLGAGPVMSYYEFKQPMAVRLTDEEWRDIIAEGNAPDPPAWTKSFLARPGR